jgi:hypothetical protein
MKTCGSCAEQIRDEASVCPFCRRRQGTSTFASVAWVVAIFTLLSFCVMQPNNETADSIVAAERACEYQGGGC